MSGTNNEQARGLRAGELEPVFRSANVLREELDRAKSEKAKATLIGSFMSKNLNREVTIEVDGRVGTAVLRQESGAGRAKRYRFEVCWTDSALVSSETPPPHAASSMSMGAVVPSAVAVVAISPPCSPQATVGGPGIVPNNSGNNESW